MFPLILEKAPDKVGFDYQPYICKDYKETRYGDSCKFMHDLGDDKSRWQMERDWAEADKVRKRKLALKGGDDDEEDEEEEIEDDEDGLPFPCFICRQPFVDPVVTKCKQYFCEDCAFKALDIDFCEYFNRNRQAQETVIEKCRMQFKEFLASKGVNATDLLNQGWQQDFEDFTRCEPSAYRRELLENLDTLEAVIHRVVNTYGVLRMKENEVNALKENGSQLHDEILHEHQIKSSVKMQSQDIQINPVQAMDDSLIVSKSSLIEPENNNAFSKSEIETQMQRQEEKVDMREAVDAGLVVTESSGTKPDKQDTSSSSGNYTTQAVDADIGPVNDEEPFAEVQLTALHNILANEQQHTEQSKPNYDTHLLETIDSNTTPTSTNMCHRGGEIDQDALLNAELLKTKDMVCMEVYNELSKRFLQLEKHCISLEISIQQKEESQNHTNLRQLLLASRSAKAAATSLGDLKALYSELTRAPK
ncbi:retrovirus-related pol polyprotein from transposon TNT 1-94 [Tanacetum coccineum]